MWFFGVGASNYGHELLHQAVNLWFNFTVATKKAVFDWYIVNVSGLGGGRKERDLLQEHHNLAIKRVHNGHLARFDSRFIREAVSLNIMPLGQLANTIKDRLGLHKTILARTDAELTADINLLGHLYLVQRHHIYHPNQLQSYLAIDALMHGYAKLRDGALNNFLDKHVI